MQHFATEIDLELLLHTSWDSTRPLEGSMPNATTAAGHTAHSTCRRLRSGLCGSSPWLAVASRLGQVLGGVLDEYELEAA
jgi:hypothetical protein